MVLRHFKLKEEPFSTTPDPRFLYKSPVHQQALERLVTAVTLRKGINAVLGEPGLGKTLLIRTLLKGFSDQVCFAWVFNTTLSAKELVRYICRDFGFKPKAKEVGDLLMELYTFLIGNFEKGLISLLIVDEAQNLQPEVLEEIRQLSNLETANKKLIQVILSGQPQLDVNLDHPSLHQLKQRICLKAVLTRLSQGETRRYIRHRLDIAGARRDDIFTDAALTAVYEISNGVPRLINQVCDNALLIAAKRKKTQVDSVLIRELLENGVVTSSSPPPVLPRRYMAAYQPEVTPCRAKEKEGNRKSFSNPEESRNNRKSLSNSEKLEKKMRDFQELDFGVLKMH